MKRVVARETQHAAEAAATQFDETIRAAREEAARRLARELELSVERFAREAEGASPSGSRPSCGPSRPDRRTDPKA